jgi:hypothetical protein
MEICLAIISDTFWFTPALLVMLAITALLAELLFHQAPAPAGGATMRLPGESLRPKLDLINAKLLVRLLATIAVAVITGVAARAVAQANNLPLVDAVMFAGSGIAMGLMLWTWRLMTPWRAAQLDLESERRVGRELNLLMLDGCRVFHDLVDKRVGEIDHIVVAPHAVFLVETHTVEPAASPGPDAVDTVVCKGDELLFPKFSTKKPLEMTAGKARWLERFLERRTGIRLPIIPILALPGWQVRQAEKGEVHVCHPKDISTVVIDKAATPLYEAQRQTIINFLDDRCQYAPF